MTTPELIIYLERCQELGIRKEQTISALLAAGWKLPHIQEGFKIIEARALPMKKPKIVFPTMQLSLSLLGLLVLGTSSVALFSNYTGQNANHAENLQANILDVQTPEEKEATTIQEQINRVSRITDGLQAYKELTGSYPFKLDVLRKTGQEILASSTQTSTSTTTHDQAYLLGLYGTKPLYEGDFNDLFTNSPFVYSATSDDYALSYVLQWNTPQAPTIETQFSNGWNIANKDSLSVPEQHVAE